jgi:MSHA biogenesis protein MshL
MKLEENCRVNEKRLVAACFVALTILASALSLSGQTTTSGGSAQPTTAGWQDESVRLLRQRVDEVELPAARMRTTRTSSFAPPVFEPWPLPPPSTNARVVPASSAPAVPLAEPQKQLYSFRAENLELKSALALFARANNLNIVPDQDVTGTVTLDVRNLPLDVVMQALLEANDMSWTQSGGLIRVRATATKQFSIDYLRLKRKGMGTSSATLSSGSGSGGSGGQGGGGASGGGGGGGLGGGGGGAGGAGGGGGGSVGGSAVNLTQENPIDFWKELQTELVNLLTPAGKTSLAIDMTAGLIQITDRPSALARVSQFLDELDDTVLRQVDLEAKLYDVTLGDQFQFGIDWEQVAKAYGGGFRLIGTPTVVQPVGGVSLRENAFTMLFSNKNTRVIVTALEEQGKVQVISQPRLRTLNNQTALIKVGTDTPFFSQNTFFVAGTAVGTTTPITEDTYQVVTVGTILSITPQISTNGWITLDVSPVITSLVATEVSPNRTTTAPVLDIKQASSLVRLRDGETIVMGGLIQNSTAKTIRKIPLIGDIPLLGKLFQGNFTANQKKELVIFLTPTIVQ